MVKLIGLLEIIFDCKFIKSHKGYIFNILPVKCPSSLNKPFWREPANIITIWLIIMKFVKQLSLVLVQLFLTTIELMTELTLIHRWHIIYQHQSSSIRKYGEIWQIVLSNRTELFLQLQPYSIQIQVIFKF